MQVEKNGIVFLCGVPNTDKIEIKNLQITPFKTIIITDLKGNTHEYGYPTLLNFQGNFHTKIDEEGNIIVTDINKRYFYIDYIYSIDRIVATVCSYKKDISPAIKAKLKEYKILRKNLKKGLNKTKELQKRIVAYHVANGEYPTQIEFDGREFRFYRNFNNVLVYNNMDKGKDSIFVKIDDTILNCLDRLDNTFKDFDDTISKDFIKELEAEYEN